MSGDMLFRKKHELFLSLMYSTLPMKEGGIASALHNMTDLSFRHLKWLGECIVNDIQNYDYEENIIKDEALPKMFDFDRDSIEVPFGDGRAILQSLLERFKDIQQYYDKDDALHERMQHDEHYFMFRLERLLNSNQAIELGNTFTGGELPLVEMLGLSEEQTAHLITILKQQQAKEYKTVLSFFYILVHIANTEVSDIFYELMQESYYHQRHYARMLISLGEFAIPGPVDKSEYQISNIKDFVQRSIAEENTEINDLNEIAEGIPNRDFQELVAFISVQEKHHIRLLDHALALLD